MKKKTIVLAYLLVLSLGTILSLYIPKNEVAAKDAIVIPGQAIRLRILANSDLESDQALKRKVRDAVNAKISVWVQDLTSITEARKVIKSKLPDITKTAEEVVNQEGSKQAVKVKFGKVQFPTKLYGQFLYPAGDYEAILITLGEGQGANWWCVLFPPLCFLDFSNGVAVSKGFEEKKATAEPEMKQRLKADDGEAKGSSANLSDEEAKGSSANLSDEEAKDSSANLSDEEAKDSSASLSDEEAKDSSASLSDEKDKAPSAKANDAKAKVAKPSDGESDFKATDSELNPDEESLEAPSAKAEEDSDSELEAKAAEAKKQVGAAAANRVQKRLQADEVVEAAALGSIAEPAKSDAKQDSNPKKEAPVYTSGDDEPVKVKFFIVELWNKLF